MARNGSPVASLIGGALALAFVLVFLLIADPDAWIFILPSLVGGGIAVLRPYDSRALALAAILVAVQGWLFLIGGYGLALLIPMALLVYGAVRNSGVDPAQRRRSVFGRASPQKRGVSV